MTDRGTNTLASRGLEEPFFPVVLYGVSVFGSGRKKVLVCYYDRKKKVLGCLGVRDYYYFYHGSDLREIIRFLREIKCIEFECNKFVLVLFRIDLIHFEHPICISST